MLVTAVMIIGQERRTDTRLEEEFPGIRGDKGAPTTGPMARDTRC